MDKEKITRIINTIFEIKPSNKVMVYYTKNNKHVNICSKEQDGWISFNDTENTFEIDGRIVMSGIKCKTLDRLRRNLVNNYFSLGWFDIVIET